MRYILVLLVLVPLGELYLWLVVSRAIGFWPTVAWTLLSGLVGGYQAKRAGLSVWRSVSLALERMEIPSTGLLEAALALVGGILLIAPGIATDAVGLLTLVPATRRLLARAVRGVVRRRIGISAVRTSFPEITGERRRDGPRGPRSVVDTTGESRD